MYKPKTLKFIKSQKELKRELSKSGKILSIVSFYQFLCG
jgi:hypothetical protein